MACANELTEDEVNCACEILMGYAKLADRNGDPTQLKGTPAIKMAKESWPKDLKTYVESNGFNTCAEGKKYILINSENIKKFIGKCADEMRKTKKPLKIAPCWEKELVAMMQPAKTAGTTKTSKTGGLESLTDTSKYTGSSKERFTEDGKGKGIAGREDRPDDSGYVHNYMGKDSYDKTH